MRGKDVGVVLIAGRRDNDVDHARNVTFCSAICGRLMGPLEGTTRANGNSQV
jgi:hypothetical protein